ncbi:hypothetical protein SSAG_03350 [Streptomyces sp. Mg1]|nr:hypothetical protein SSAG_03350 [Streptomyces sp. Mg1]
MNGAVGAYSPLIAAEARAHYARPALDVLARIA